MAFQIGNFDSGIYRYVDRVKNLKIRVSIKKSTNLNLKLGKDTNLSDAIEMKLLKENESQGVETRVFTWQNKVLNKRELNYYSDGNNCVTFLDHKYNDMISTLDPSNMTTYLYTYTDADYKTSYCKDYPKTEVILKEKSSNSTLRNRKNLKFGKIENHTKPSFPTDLKLSHCKTCLQNFSKHQTMFIMADLNPTDISEDTLLAILHADENGILTITPDFNSAAKPYIIQNSKLETFEYLIENASEDITKESKKKEDEKYSQMCFKHARYLKRCVGTEFEMPEHGILKLFIMAEIVKATNFGNKPLFIFYNVDFPSGWSVPDTSWLTGITQVSKPTIKNKIYTSHFSYPIEGHAEFAINYFNFEENIFKWPVIMVEISSKDSWGCVRAEGYGYVEIPLEPGCHELTIHTWKPINTSPITQLRHHFIGSVNEINDLSYVKFLQNQEKVLSRLGFHTESSGLLKLKVNVLHQSQSFLLLHEKKDLLSKLQLSSSSHSVQTVIMAFQKARNKMLSARKKLLTPERF